MKCYYHSVDPDGWYSALLIKKMCEDKEIPFSNYDFIGCDYKSPIDFSIVKPNEDVFIVDYSLSSEKDQKALLELTNRTSNIIWIDHHDDSINFFNKYDYLIDVKIKGIAENIRYLSAAKLVYIFITYGLEECDDIIERYRTCKLDNIAKCLDDYYEIPDIIKYVSDHDNFVHTYQDTLAFINALQVYKMEDEFSSLPILPDPFLENSSKQLKKIISSGHIINKYLEIQNKIISRDAYEVEYQGHKLYALNRKANSLAFDDLYYKCDGVITYYFDGKMWRYGIFTNLKNENHINCGDIARLFGGGGREGAAGFSCNYLAIIKDNNNKFVLEKWWEDNVN